jgi:hypothetical protein
LDAGDAVVIVDRVTARKTGSTVDAKYIDCRLVVDRCNLVVQDDGRETTTLASLTAKLLGSRDVNSVHNFSSAMSATMLS